MNTIHTKKSHHIPMDLALFHRIDINLYPLFIAIYEQNSISKAAQILFITQSAASHALQRLRQLLNDDLFVRSGSKMRATPFAEQIYPAVKYALIAIQNISQQKNSFDPQQIQHLKIAVHDEIEPIIFPKLVQHFQSLNIGIQFISIRLDRKTLASDLAVQQIDFAFDLEQNFGEKIQFQRLFEDQFVVCSHMHEMNTEIYLSAMHLGVSSRRTGLLLEDIYLNQKQLSREILLRCQHYSTALQILEQIPNSILTIPQSILNNLNISDALKIYESPIELPKISLGIYWHLNMKENLRHRFLVKEISKIFA
ncbi:LysR family transcriptional regulator [Acinetobacter sp. 194]|uniref:LysR family transcriptional regulator n=1 Tax=Acinetobacter shaoyimingii TaxID=2715164 RepID=UPI00140C38C9|nr:LysR family transcriptional regulator [Acinetobacter shaoyimingii]NHB57467.1 LysR family transcriptional regulator [Acinetobacter shaoyimingii]